MPSLRSRLLKRFIRHQTSVLGQGQSIQEIRHLLDRFAEKVIRLPRGAIGHAISTGNVPALWIEPKKASATRVILYLHGGGYTICSPTTHRGMAGRLALASQARLLLIDYRLAPEYPFPAALEDALTAYHWLQAEGISPHQIAIGGDSAGGGLTLSTAVSLRQAGEHLPGALFLISPWIDLSLSGETIHTLAESDPVLHGGGDGSLPHFYAGAENPTHPLISPLFADLNGLPPTLIQVGSDEILLSDSTRLEEKMNAAGVDVGLEIWEGMWHVFQAATPLIPEAQQAIRRIGSFVKMHIP